MSRPRSIEDETLLQKSMQVFWANGFTKTGIRELEQALGMKAPSIYNRFDSKEGLFQAALEHYLDTVIGWRIKHYLQANDPFTGLRQFFDTTYNYISDTAPPLSCMLVNTALESSGKNEVVIALLTKGAQMIRTAFQENLRRVQQQGCLSENANIFALSEYLHLSLQGLLVTSKVERDTAQLKQKVDMLFSMLPLTSTARTANSL